ncbi:protein of unknown function [Hyphomicrobium sp. MC1]|nr:protein of unknown function [Hyphomicrobium sp. MC1]
MVLLNEMLIDAGAINFIKSRSRLLGHGTLAPQ